MMRGDLSASLASLADAGSALSQKARMISQQATSSARRMIGRI
jgi:hypothetical protein